MEATKLNEISWVVKFPKRVDSINAPELETEINEFLNQGATAIIIDFSDNFYLSSAGIRVILAIFKKLKSRAGRLAVASMRQEIKNVFDMTCMNFFNESIKSYPNLPTAKLNMNLN